MFTNLAINIPINHHLKSPLNRVFVGPMKNSTPLKGDPSQHVEEK